MQPRSQDKLHFYRSLKCKDIFFGLGSLIIAAFPVVPEGATTNGVDDDEEYEEDNVHLSHFFPRVLEIVEQTSLARLAVVA